MSPLSFLPAMAAVAAAGTYFMTSSFSPRRCNIKKPNHIPSQTSRFALSTEQQIISGETILKRIETTSYNKENGSLEETCEEEKKREENPYLMEIKRQTGTESERKTMKDYFEEAKKLIRSDRGPPRWFSPLECGSRLENSPLLLFLPGIDGFGTGLIMHHHSLGKIFDIWCLHIPAKDRTSFPDLVKLVERTVRAENCRSPNRPIYLVGESLGACLALAVAARNPDVDLLLILANPATSFTKSRLQPIMPVLEVIPNIVQFSLPYLLGLMTGDPLSTMMDNAAKGLPLQRTVGGLTQDVVAMPSYLGVLADILPGDTLLWKLQMFKSASTYVNSRLHSVKSQTLILSRLHMLATSPVMLSTLEDGNVVRGLAGVPSEGPVLYIGYHMLLGFELIPMVTKFLLERNILLRGIAHPMMFTRSKEGRLPALSTFDTYRRMGAVPVSGNSIFRLLSSKAHVLLYPGGIREACHRKGEQYKLFWPEQSEFVRIAARFGAKIVPFGVVGEDDFGEVVFDYDDQMKIPYLRDFIEGLTDETSKVRSGVNGEVNQAVHLPGVLPKFPGRFYFYYGKPIETEARKQELNDKKKAHELYLQVKSEVENCIAFLQEKRENDPYRNLLARLAYHAAHGFDSEVPTFEL